MADGAPQYPTRSLLGQVEAANERGFKLSGEWLNYGNYYKGEHVAAGDEVAVTVRGRFVQELHVKGRNDGAGAAAPVRAMRRPQISTVGREREIRRLALIKAAADYAAGRPKLTPDDALSIAIQWEAWVLDEELEADGETPAS